MTQTLETYLTIAKDKWAELRPYYPHLTAAGIAILLGLIVGIFKVSAAPNAVDTADRWPLPQWSPFRAGPQRDALVNAGLWPLDPTKAVAAEEKKVAAPPWRFIGTIQEGKSRLAVLEVEEGRRVQRFGSGETLPNGARIVDIAANSLRYDDGGVEKVLKLFSADLFEEPGSGNGKN